VVDDRARVVGDRRSRPVLDAVGAERGPVGRRREVVDERLRDRLQVAFHVCSSICHAVQWFASAVPSRISGGMSRPIAIRWMHS
jgi:hypothetical protein